MHDHEHGDGPLLAGHGSAKQTESTDPLELRGASVPGGDPEVLARCLIEEFASMGHGAGEILELFRAREYVALHAFWQAAGDEAVTRLIDEVIARCGVLRVTEEHAPPEEEPCPHQHEADGTPARAAVSGSGLAPAGPAAASSPGPLHQIELPGQETP